MRHLLPAGASLATAFALLLVAASPAAAGIGMSSSMSMPSAVVVGQHNLAGSFTVSNTNTPPNNTESNTVTQMKLAPSCGADGTTVSACPSPDPAMVSIDSPASGDATTSCAGSTFTVSAPDANGIVTFTRVGGALVLAPPGGANSCKVNFAFDVHAIPTIDVDGALGGVQTFANLLASATGTITPATVSTAPTLKLTVNERAADAASDTTVRGDFDGDGISDLAIGVPGEGVGPAADAGAVAVLYGSGTGATASGSQLWNQDSSGIADSVEIGDRFGSTLTAGDFNGDGRDDLAIGSPTEDLGSAVDAGAVNVIYGSALGLSSTNNQLWSQSSTGIADPAEPGDRFGSALAAGSLDSDGNAELVVGVPDENVAAYAGAGIVHVIPSSAAGLTSAGSQLWSQNSSGIAGVSEAGDNFGASLAVNAFNATSGLDLAIGAPGQQVGTDTAAGVVHVIYGSAGGLTSAGNQQWSQDSAGVADSTETGDRFGTALASGRLDNDSLAELVIGVPAESVAAYAGAGIVHVLNGGPAALTATGSQLWNQNSSGIADISEAGDNFGESLAVGTIDSPAGQDLAIGAPGEDVGAIVDGGAAHVIYGSASGLTSASNDLWRQDTAGNLDTIETGDRFGSAVAIGDLDADTRGDLVVGVPDESVGAVAGAGIVHVIRGTAVGATATDGQLWSQNTPGIADSAEVGGDGFGGALGA